MPRQSTSVKNKTRGIHTLGVVDLHFHGAYGIDLMTAGPAELDRLALQLRRDGVAAFCPTTLSASPSELLKAVARLGKWIRSTQHRSYRGARPLGIHLEGPFIARGACGAHPPKTIRQFSLKELERLWEGSLGTLKILTVAPEILTAKQLVTLASWARHRKIRLSIGHSRAEQRQAQDAFDAGFTSLTHAWNAMPFHHRAPGPLGAALGRKGIFLELIPDGIHVDPTIIRWTRALHPKGLCFISDCVTSGQLKVRLKNGAARLPNGDLAGGARTLAQAFTQWVHHEAKATKQSPKRLLHACLPYVTTHPLRALGLAKIANF